MNPAGSSPDSTEAAYCRFGKRDLDRMSWMAPLVNNRFGVATIYLSWETRTAAELAGEST